MPFRASTALVVAAVLSVVAGCATKDANRVPPPKHGIAEYLDLTAEALGGVGDALEAVAKVSTCTNTISSEETRAFDTAVEQLEVRSLQVRERAEAIQARGDAYFEHWQENLARMEDPRVRELASRRRSDLEASFAKIKQVSQATRQTFRAFLAGLRKLRILIEADPNAMSFDSTKATVDETTAQGKEVEQGLGRIREELTRMKLMVTPGGDSGR